MKILVCGGRDFNDGTWVHMSLDRLNLKPLEDLIIQGGALGADYLAREWAWVMAIPFLTVPAPWARNGKSAGIIRNLRMRDFMGLKPDLVVAFPGENGTAHMVKVASEAGILLWLPQQGEGLPSQLNDQLRTHLNKA